MSPKENALDAFIEATLHEDFDKKQEEERAKFEAELPGLVARRRDIAAKAIKGQLSAKGNGSSGVGNKGERLSWTRLDDAKKEKWIGEIIDAGKGKGKREALVKAFQEAEGFKLRESVIDKIQATSGAA
jgi:hypothetical protein